MYEISSVIYRINARDEIIFANDRWNQFASGNNSINLMRHEIIGRSIWDFIADYSTRDLYRELVEKVREGKTMQFKYRCDSPDQRRHMEMHIKLHEGDVQFDSRTLYTEDRLFQKLFAENTVRSDEALVICSFCKKINLDEDWKELEEAVQISGVFENENLPCLSHGICGACFGGFTAKLKAKNTDYAFI